MVSALSRQIALARFSVTTVARVQQMPEIGAFSSGVDDPSLEAKLKRDREQKLAVHRPLLTLWGLPSRCGCFVLAAGDEPLRRVSDFCEDVVHGKRGSERLLTGYVPLCVRCAGARGDANVYFLCRQAICEACTTSSELQSSDSRRR